MDICPTCHRPLASPLPLLDAASLLEILTNGTPHREVYRGDKTQRWFVTYGGGEASADAVRELVRTGKIHSVYNTCPSEAYHVGRTVDMDATMRARKLGRDKKKTVYVSEA